MSHFIKIYAVCKFSYFLLWYLNELKDQSWNIKLPHLKLKGELLSSTHFEAVCCNDGGKKVRCSHTLVGTPVAQRVKRRPTDLAGRVRSSLEVKSSQP